jgi:hypothetical protein
VLAAVHRFRAKLAMGVRVHFGPGGQRISRLVHQPITRIDDRT